LDLPEQYEQHEQPEQYEQYEQSEQREQPEQSEQFIQFLQSIRLSSAFCAASVEPKCSTEHLLLFASSIHVVMPLLHPFPRKRARGRVQNSPLQSLHQRSVK
jgi:hypothetical protein